MYLQKFTIRQIKSFADVTLDFQQPDGSIRLWNVIIGENGTGKTTLLQAISIALAGQKAASVLLPRPRGWVRMGAERGEIEATILPASHDGQTTPQADLKTPIQSRYAIIEDSLIDGPTIQEEPTSDQERLQEMAAIRGGGFAAGYGPFRRLSGGSEQATQLANAKSREARFVTLFREDAALTHCEQWLKDLDYARLDSSDPVRQQRSRLLLQAVQETINSYLLPQEVRLERIHSQGVYFKTPYANKVHLSDLSDGYRAMLALGIDLLRHLSQSDEELLLQNSKWLHDVTGVVLIDELDAHMHPTWQREISFWLKERFPRLQFIVATHSPFVPQAADKGGLYVLRRQPHAEAVQAVVDEPYVRGWRADQILTILFNTPGMYDPETERRLREYARLKILADMGQLPAEQAQSFAKLQTWMDANLAPAGHTRHEMQRARDVQKRAQELSQLFRERTRIG
ncbi:MAG: AAA family ATPase [Ardenticatenaceae bacterium]